MRHPFTGREIEIKLRVVDVAALRRRLRELRARKIHSRTYESNTLYDTSRNDLTRRGCLVRLRIEHSARKRKKSRPNRNSTVILTYKGPAPRSPGAKTATKRSERLFKIREEAEVTLCGAEQMARILRALGLRPVFRYEKLRTTYTLPGIRNVKVEFDETPVGLFLELEGTIAAIGHAARNLGYSQSDYINETYGALHVADCRRRGIRPSDMLFRPIKKMR